MGRLNRKNKVPRHIALKKPKNPKVLKKLAVAILITLVAATLYTATYTHTRDHKNTIKLQNTVQQLQQSKTKLELDSSANDKAKQQKIEELNKQLQETQKQLQAKRNAATVYAESVSYAVPTDYAKAYIYGHESGNCPTKWQGEHVCSGYHGTPSDPNVGYGLCQATPGWKMASAGADWATNYDTQDRWCTNYANSRYGGWQGAYQAWISKHWW